jgi:predicted DCC family thiol-disulfide oxidoreductase YuxK
MAAPSGWPVLRPVFDAAYRWFARHRKQIGRILDRRQNLSRTGR